MENLKTRFMGIELSNPVIAGASDLTADVDAIKRIEAAGAGAIVLKSLFEEQIQYERLALEEAGHRGDSVYAEMATVFPTLNHGGPREHLMWVKKSKQSVKVPVIASLNAVERDTWVEYARLLADQGVDGLELNFFAVPRDAGMSGSMIEEEQLEVISQVSAMRLPVSVKLSQFYTNPLNFIARAVKAGARGLTLFNRFFHPDIDVETVSLTHPLNFSTPADNRLPLRYSGLLYGTPGADVCASTGVLTGADTAKMILAGASAVQVVTALYRHGIGIIAKIKEDLSAWMKRRNYGSISDFQGLLSRKNSKSPWAYTRTQYAKLLLGPKDLDPAKG